MQYKDNWTPLKTVVQDENQQDYILIQLLVKKKLKKKGILIFSVKIHWFIYISFFPW